MTTSAQAARSSAERLHSKIAGTVAGATCSAIKDFTEIAGSTFTVQLGNGLRLTIASDFEDPRERFQVLRSGAGQRPLAFERWIDGDDAVHEDLNQEELVALVLQYASEPPQELPAESDRKARDGGG